MIVALNSLLLVVPWHANAPQDDKNANETHPKEDYVEYIDELQDVAVAFVVIFVFEVSAL